MTLRDIRIEEGCIACNLCEDLAPDVFRVPAGGNCEVRPEWSERLSASPDLEPAVREAAASCPVEVIRLDDGSGAGGSAIP
jgi:ferredoxin